MKNEIRKINKTKRIQMTAAEVEQKSTQAANAFLTDEIYKSCKTLMLYMPLGNEVDTAEIIKQAYRDGKRVVFPVTEKGTGIITPFFANKDTCFAEGNFCVKEPRDAEPAPLLEIDTIIVPGIAFDRTGARVGFGKGCYDMLLKNTQAVRVGLCYDFQLYDQIPAEEHDASMDFLVTENGVFKCKKGV